MLPPEYYSRTVDLICHPSGPAEQYCAAMIKTDRVIVRDTWKFGTAEILAADPEFFKILDCMMAHVWKVAGERYERGKRDDN